MAGAVAVGAPYVSLAKQSQPADARGRPRHIIHLVSDGMSMGTLTCSDHLSLIKRGKGLTWVGLYRNPASVSGLMDMRCLNSLVTDSSAASSSWGSGSRIMNGWVNDLLDHGPLKTLYELFGEQGWKRALVTTTEITHATPAGFAAKGVRRSDAEAIAAQYLAGNVEVMLGGGQKYFASDRRKDKRDLAGEYLKAGYEIMRTSDELSRASRDKKWLGIFNESHLPYSVDQASPGTVDKSVPTLAAMTERALARLENENHFIMQVEGGRVDHGCHTCDAAAAFSDQIAFDEALDVCVKFQQRQPETLIVITTDHGNGNPGLNGLGSGYALSTPLFYNLKSVRNSFEVITREFRSAKTPAEIAEIIFRATDYKISPARLERLIPYALSGAGKLPASGKPLFGLMDNLNCQLGQLLANHIGVSWTGNAHTADYVPLLAIGPGAKRFGGFIQNVDVFRHYTELAGIDFRNPTRPLQDGFPARARLRKNDSDAHWHRSTETGRRA